MDRREWLKILAFGGTGLAVAGWPHNTSASDSFFAVTDRPQALVNKILELSRQARADVNVDIRAVAPVSQDLAVLRHGTLVNPSRMDRISDSIGRLATELRQSSAPGTHMVSVEPRTVRSGEIVFECDGRVVDSIDPAGSYERIVVTGRQGDTVFKLAEGTLSVVWSSCRHELCKATGPINSGRIICAPNRLIASIGTPYAAVDAITG